MSGLLEGLEEGGLYEGEAEIADAIRAEFAKLEELFNVLEASEARLIPIPGLGIPSLAMVREIATVQALRAIKLVEGSAILLQQLNYPSALPAVRALFETWVMLAYANVKFRELGIYGDNWAKFDEWARRLLSGRSSPDSPVPHIKIGVMVGDVLEMFREPLQDDEGAEVGGAVDASGPISQERQHRATGRLFFPVRDVREPFGRHSSDNFWGRLSLRGSCRRSRVGMATVCRIGVQACAIV